MHASQIQSQLGVPPSSSLLSAYSCAITGLIAFPSSLAVLWRGIKWNASCWLANQSLDEFEHQQIVEFAFSGQQRTPHIEWCYFASDVEDKVSILIVFPELRTSFRTPEIMQRWTDTVVLPAFRHVGISVGSLTSSFQAIQIAAEDAKRKDASNAFTPETPLVRELSKTGLSTQDMQSLWTAIQENAHKTPFFAGFRNIFLVATCRQHRGGKQSRTACDGVQSVMTAWDEAIDMNFVPASLVRANTAPTAETNLTDASDGRSDEAANIMPAYRPSADSIWESSRKRKASDEIETEKRSRAENGCLQPLSVDRLHTLQTQRASGFVDEDTEMGT
ncbi:uncharacterized protein PV09_04299 [Verruconis gallopava]|uniref:Uncharacterized protein n=1 Tax=Verruconis gallopava TaxID=253628 RepID=A0A0D2ADM0_9PEZI|nr:uncharacterized protein PV09_04299 [Verruconis gallopava]KIW04545.1 hypothetical protein PV09_04299 [Verruconis gallopava]